MTLLEGLKIHNHEAAPYVILGVHPPTLLPPHGLSLLPKSEEPHLYEARNSRRVQHGGPRSRFCSRCQAWKVPRLQHGGPRSRFLRRKQARSLSRALTTPSPLSSTSSHPARLFAVGSSRHREMPRRGVLMLIQLHPQ